MSRNGSGTYSRVEADYVFNTVIDETKVNNEFDDLGNEITASIAKDGQTNPTANLPMNSFKHTGVAAGTARTDYSDVASVQDGGYLWGGTGGGTADVITITLAPTVSAYATGMEIRFIASGANTTNVTLNVDSIGAKAVTKHGTTALVAGDIKSGQIVKVTYDGTRFLLGTVSDQVTDNILDGTTNFTKLDVDNLTLDGNAITSTDAAGDITITPDTTGDLVLDGLKWPQADGTAEQLLKTDGAAQIGYISQSSLLYPPGFINGLILSNDAGDATNDINITAGSCVDSTDATNITLSSEITKQIDASWVVGDDAGGFPSGLTLTNDTWYHVFLIRRSDTGVVDAGFDTSLTATNLLIDASSYDSYRRIGSVRRDTAANKAFFQNENIITYDIPIQDVSLAAGSTTRQLITLSAPPDIKFLANVAYHVDMTANADHYYLFYDPAMTDSTPSAALFTGGVSDFSGVDIHHTQIFSVRTNTSAQAAERSTSTASRSIMCFGYTDARGQQ